MTLAQLQKTLQQRLVKLGGGRIVIAGVSTVVTGLSGAKKTEFYIFDKEVANGRITAGSPKDALDSWWSLARQKMDDPLMPDMDLGSGKERGEYD